MDEEPLKIYIPHVITFEQIGGLHRTHGGERVERAKEEFKK